MRRGLYILSDFINPILNLNREQQTPAEPRQDSGAALEQLWLAALSARNPREKRNNVKLKCKQQLHQGRE